MFTVRCLAVSSISVSQPYSRRHWVTHSPIRLPGKVLVLQWPAHCIWLTLSVIWPSVLVTVLGVLISESNGLSQFIEDTVEPSIPVWEFNLVACQPSPMELKTPFQTWIWTQAGERHQPVSPAVTACGLLTVAFSPLSHLDRLYHHPLSRPISWHREVWTLQQRCCLLVQV